MKDLKCPSCSSRSVPFWPVFWGIGWFKVVRCTACETRVKHDLWKRIFADVIVTIAGIILTFIVFGIASFYPLTGPPLFVAMMFVLGWSRTMLLKLVPVEEKGKEHTP
jgi:hypothetical protein